MTSVVDKCAQQCLFSDGQITLFDSLPPFDEDLAEEVTVEELTLPAPIESLDDNHGASGSSLPATPAERPCTFCPSSLPLPPATCSARATLVLDLDGTLIASEEVNSAISAYLWNTPAGARSPDYEAMGRRVWLRPGVREFLTAVRPHFEIVLFTAATQNWAAAAIEQLDPLAELFDVMLHRDHTTSDLMWDYVKDLSRLGRDLARVIIVDDNPLMFMYQPDNALHIGAYEASVAGGPDNVLPRVAEVLINQVAPVSDVRDVLGPMASAKSSITSTVSVTAQAVATEPQSEHQAETTAISAYGVVSFSSARSPGDQHLLDAASTAAACYSTNCTADAGELVRDAFFSDEQCTFGCMNTKSQVQQQEHSVEQQQLQELHPAQPGQREGNYCSNEVQVSFKGSIAPRNAVQDNDWEGDSEGAETFDEHGAAAQLGAGVTGSPHRHCAWEQAHFNPGDVTVVAAPTSNTQVQENGEHNDSDACPSEEHSVHSSEVFEALMDDAMAEYDSDAYESPYGSAGCDYSCRAATAVPASSPMRSPVNRSHDCSDGSEGSCPEYGCTGGCDLPSCAFSKPYAASIAGGLPVVSNCDGTGGSAKSPNAHMGKSEATHRDEIALVPADIRGKEGVALGGVTTLAALSSCCESAACLCPPFEDTHLWQPQLPTGMVFLMDLNPAFGSGCSPSDAGQAAPAEVCGAPAIQASGELMGINDLHSGKLPCKRVRSERDAGEGDLGGVRGVVARLSCDDTPRSSRVRCAGRSSMAGDVPPAATGDTSSPAVTKATPMACTSC